MPHANPTFPQWLERQNLDAQSWSPELQRSLRARYELECRPALIEPSTVAIVAPVQCQWPQRAYRVDCKQDI